MDADRETDETEKKDINHRNYLTLGIDSIAMEFGLGIPIPSL